MKPGLFDLPAPLLAALDGALAHVIPAAVRVILYGLAVSWIGMRIYAAASNQRRLRAVQRRTRQVRVRLRDPGIDFAPLLALSRTSVMLSLRHLALVLLPSLLAALPLMLVLPWASNTFGARPPAAGTPVRWCAVPADGAARVRIGAQSLDATDGCATLPWPSTDIVIEIGGKPAATAPWTGSSEVLHARQWWNALIANPAGALPADVGDLQITVAFPARSLIGAGPDWLGHWLVLLLVPGFLAGLYWRWRWKIV